ncbi:Uncharacterized protein FKW44_022877, partial [Caligus rogercresseyi]
PMGSPKNLQNSLKNQLPTLVPTETLSTKDYYPGDEILSDVKEEGLLLVVIISTYSEGAPPQMPNISTPGLKRRPRTS